MGKQFPAFRGRAAVDSLNIPVDSLNFPRAALFARSPTVLYVIPGDRYFLGGAPGPSGPGLWASRVNFPFTEFSEVRFEGPERLVESWRLRLEYRL